MSELIQDFSYNNLGQTLGTWLNRRLVSLSTHWLAMVNTFFFLYVGLPFLAPVLLANGYTNSANAIYWVYHLLCHSFPSESRPASAIVVLRFMRHFLSGESSFILCATLSNPCRQGGIFSLCCPWPWTVAWASPASYYNSYLSSSYGLWG